MEPSTNMQFSADSLNQSILNYECSSSDAKVNITRDGVSYSTKTIGRYSTQDFQNMSMPGSYSTVGARRQIADISSPTIDNRAHVTRSLPRPSTQHEAKMDCIQNLLSILTLSPDNDAELSKTMLKMSKSPDNCISMRQAGCISLLVQMINSNHPREIKDRAAQALQNIIHIKLDDKVGRKEVRVWKLLEHVREYCYYLEDMISSNNDGKHTDDDMSKHPSQSVAALMKVSFDEEHRHVVCFLGGLQVLSYLVTIDQSAHGSQIDDPTCITMRKYAGMTLTNLTFGDGNNKSLLCSFKGFMTALVEQLESANDDMRQVTSAVLRNLSWRADSNSKQVLREVGAVKGLTLAAMSCQKEATLKSVLSALWNLTAHCSDNKVALCSVDGALGFLVDMLSYNSPNKTLAIIENAGGIMRNVSSHIAIREDYRQILRERNCLSVLLHHLKSPSLTVVSNACGTLWNLSARCPQDQLFLWDHGAVPMLQSLMHSKHKMIAMGSSAALKNLLNSRPGKQHPLTLDVTARNMNLPTLPTLGARKQKALEQEIDQNLAETCDNIEPANSPTTRNKAEKHLLSATERQLAMNLARHRMTSSSPIMSTFSSQNSFYHNVHSVSLSSTLQKGSSYSRTVDSSPICVNRSDSKDSVTSAQSDSVLDRMSGKAPIPTPRSFVIPKQKLILNDEHSNYVNLSKIPRQPPVPPPRSESVKSYNLEKENSDEPVDYSQQYCKLQPKTVTIVPTLPKTPEHFEKGEEDEEVPKNFADEDEEPYTDYQETDLDQPTDYSLKYAENQLDHDSEAFDQPVIQDDTVRTFCTEGTPYETPAAFSTATSMTDLRAIEKNSERKVEIAPVKFYPEVAAELEEKDSCSLEQHNNDSITTKDDALVFSQATTKQFDSKFSSGQISPEKPVNYCDEGTPGYFSRVSSLSSLDGKADDLEPIFEETNSPVCEAINNEAEGISTPKDEQISVKLASEEGTSATNTPGCFVEDTPLMFSRSSSLGSIPECDDHNDDQGSVQSEISHLASGYVSPSEIPDSPGGPLSPRHDSRKGGKDWCERDACLSPLTIENVKNDQFDNEDPAATKDHLCEGVEKELTRTIEDSCQPYFTEDTPAILSKFGSNSNLSAISIETNLETPKLSVKVDTCRVYETEDTPAIMSKVGSDGNLSVLSIESLTKPIHTVRFDEVTTKPNDTFKVFCTEDTPAALSKVGSDCNLSAISMDDSEPIDKKKDSSTDSSNLSDGENVLVECIERGIAKVIKSNTSYDSPSRNFNSLPPYLEPTYENIGYAMRDNAKSVPPLPKRGMRHNPPPVPPRVNESPLGSDDERIFNMAIQAGISKLKDRGKKHSASRMKTRDPNDSFSSIDSYGSTDREIFERCVTVGVDTSRHKSLERPKPNHSAKRFNRSLDRKPKSDSDSFSNESFGSADREVFERSVKAGMSKNSKNAAAPSAIVANSAVVADGDGDVECGFDSYDTLQIDEEDGLSSSKVKRSDTSETLCPTVLHSPTEYNNSMASLEFTNKMVETVLPDLLGESGGVDTKRIPDLMHDVSESLEESKSYNFLLTDSLEHEAALLTTKIKQFNSLKLMSSSQQSDFSLDLSKTKPPSNMGSLISLTQSVCNDESTADSLEKMVRKKSLPPLLMYKGGLSFSLTSHGSADNFASLIDDVKPPSLLDRITDLENSTSSVASITSEIAESKHATTPVTFDFSQPVSAQKFINPSFSTLSDINPPSLFEELLDITLEAEKRDNIDTDTYNLESESDLISLQSISLMESSNEQSEPLRSNKYQQTAKERRLASAQRYKTFVIKNFSKQFNFDDPEKPYESFEVRGEEPKVTQCDKGRRNSSTNSTSEDCAVVDTENRPKRKLSAKQRRSVDRERYQTQQVSLKDLTLTSNESIEKELLESDSQDAKPRKTMKQNRLENSDRFKTRTIHDDLTSSPNESFKDVYVDNAETTTGYDSLSSIELNHQQLNDEYTADVPTQVNPNYMLTYTKSSKIQRVNTSTVEAKNRHNLELNQSYENIRQPDSELKKDDSTVIIQEKTLKRELTEIIVPAETTPKKLRPKVVKPNQQKVTPSEAPTVEENIGKGVRGRAKAPYVSPYSRNSTSVKNQTSKPSQNNRNLNGNKPVTSKAKRIPSSTNTKVSPITTPQRRPDPIKVAPLVRQGTFTKEPSPATNNNSYGSNSAKSTSNTSKLPFRNVNTIYGTATRPPIASKLTCMKKSPSKNGDQNYDSLKSRTANSIKSESKQTKEVTSRIASLWKKVEQAKKQQSRDTKVFPESKLLSNRPLVRSSTFENPPKKNATMTTATKQKSALGMRETQIPVSKFGRTPAPRTSGLKLFTKKDIVL